MNLLLPLFLLWLFAGGKTGNVPDWPSAKSPPPKKLPPSKGATPAAAHPIPHPPPLKSHPAKR